MPLVKPKPIIADVNWGIGENVDGLFIQKGQEITDEFLQELADSRFDSKNPAREYHRVASIPVGVVEKWMREGFNILTDKNITPAQIVARLKKEGLDAFIATNKRV